MADESPVASTSPANRSVLFGTHAGRLRLRFVRHGETDWNREGRIQGHLDVPLNARGREQARQVAEELRGSGATLVLSSDLSRARDTAVVIAEVLGVPLRVVPDLRERNLGVLQGKTAADLGASDGGMGFVSRMVNDPRLHPPGGEALDAFRERVAAFVRGLVADPPAEDIVVVTHGGVVRAALLALVGSDRRDVVARIGNCSVTEVVVDERGARVVADATSAEDAAHAADESLAM